ncbi:MAG TPA: AsmA-like C-terminal region-containing protein, partial [Candidatus Polarisedimenticolia bacterium]|nr:AsmA-like C-terminal region-containing protein [Candidatus Polarisedimenticolia bacterium]
DRELINGKARLMVTNFTVRGEPAESFQSDLQYSNRVLTLFEPRVQISATQQIRADIAKLVFDERKMYVTNVFSTADPDAVVHAIGPHAEHVIDPYHFLKPPLVHVDGIVPLHDPHDADLHFDVDGGDFQWWRFQVPRITGKVDWVGEHLAVRDVQTDFYLGKASGNADFDFLPNHTANYRFNLVASDANLHVLAKDLTEGKTNKLEGLLNLRVEVTGGNSADLLSVQGAGRADLRDGLIWDIPIFGIFSPALDTIMPGLGSSRARQGSATFTITNGVIDSEDLKIETLMARLRYWGTIDLKGAVNARMEAELFRNTWVVGPVLSLALWPVSKTFEYKITGDIHKPKSEPVFIPRIFFFPLHPMQTIKDMIPPPEQSSTNLFPEVAP